MKIGIMLQISVPNDISMLGFLSHVHEAFVEEVRRQAGSDALVPQRLEVALSEAVSNAVFHGNQRQPDARLQIVLRYDATGQELIVAVQDGGSGFDPERLPTPSTTLHEGGRGIFLIKHIMDSVTSESVPDGHILTMRKKIGPQA